ncbi:MAG: hypothetical protein ABI396_05670 [Ktedonobacteraceae bacterium]
MKRTYVSKLHINGTYYLIGAVLLLLGVPLYQLLILIPQGYSDAIASTDKGLFTSYLSWLGNHPVQFLGYRVILLLAFAILITLPFTLFRIIIAQELLGREEEDHIKSSENTVHEETPLEAESAESSDNIDHEETELSPPEDGMPDDAWRGKGFAVLAAWSGFLGILFYVLGTLASSIYLAITINGFTIHSTTPSNFSALSSTFTIIANTVGGGLLALACLFFGAIIARSGRNLWPGMWVAFGYVAVATGALLSGSAVGVVSTPVEGQAALTTPAILLFALWVLWFAIMLLRLKPEP